MSEARSNDGPARMMARLPRRFRIILLTLAIVIGAVSAYLYWTRLD